MVRNDGKEISLNLNGNNLVLTFIGNGTSGGRKDAVSGEYVFHLNGN
ncbi:MAG: hypothetical protein HC811_12755 [Flammeovirgaceae bacterium]|nr:hypothetical protein [Flammeovirgaceae bacterium]